MSWFEWVSRGDQGRRTKYLTSFDTPREPRSWSTYAWTILAIFFGISAAAAVLWLAADRVLRVLR